MKQDQNLRFVIIGMGYLMEYIAPCYSKLLGDKKAEQMLGVTAEPQAVQTKAKATGIFCRDLILGGGFRHPGRHRPCGRDRRQGRGQPDRPYGDRRW